jgi:hypothetical protein
MKFSGVLVDDSSKPLAGTVGVTFSLYKEEQGGAPLWVETQNVQPDNHGHYAVMLGSASSQGLPADLFTDGEPRWIGVRPQGQTEQPRIMLASVPYAMKASDAATVGGLPASAFMLAPLPSSSSSAAVSSGPSSQANLPSLGGTGTTDFLPLWTNSTTLGSSVLFQLGSGSTAKVGINTTSPASTLDVNGAGTFRGLFKLPATGTATATTGKNSQAEDFVASAFSSATHAAVNQTFQWQAEPTGNNTSSPSGTLNLLFGSGTATPAETGLKLTNKGIFSFAAGQTFPGTGTVTSVASGAGLTGGLITKTGALSIAAGGVTNGMLQNSTVTVKAGTDLTGGGVVALGGSTTLNLDTTKVPQLATANTFAASQSVVGSIFPDVTGTNNSSSSPGVIFGGTGSGESITSNRTNSFFNQFGLDFYTNFATRMSIYQDGTIGMGNSTEKFGGTQVFINPPAGDNGNDGLIANGQISFDPGFNGGNGISVGGGRGGVGGFDGAGGVFFGGCCAGSGDGMVVWPGSGIAAFFEGDVAVFGNLSKTGGSFKIDHPLDPANKYLYHSFVESPDMKNIYDGVVTLDANGETVVVLPDWFDALNRDFRYQLTSIGAPGPNLYISQEVSGNRFSIAGGQPGMKVSWQVTGTRQDAWANAHRIPVEEEKSAQERGYYIAPELFGQPAEKQITNARHPEMLRKHKAVLEQSRNAAQALQQYQKQGLHLERLARPAVQPSGSPNP